MKRKADGAVSGVAESTAVDDAGSSSTADGGVSPSKLTRSQQAKMERNRQRALLLRQARLQRNPTSAVLEDGCSARVLRVQGARLVDSGGGFFIDEEQQRKDAAAAASTAGQTADQPPAPLAPDQRPPCQDCGTSIANSFLMDNFEWPVCDPCRREQSDKYALISRTEAKLEYILRDDDLDTRPPPLPHICRRNPHRTNGSPMKLYLRLQVEKRALVVWGSEEELEKALDLREEKKEKIKRNKFNRRVKSLRMEMRSSLYRRDLSRHEHTYGDEVYNEQADSYSRVCTECKHTYTYEKM